MAKERKWYDIGFATWRAGMQKTKDELFKVAENLEREKKRSVELQDQVFAPEEILIQEVLLTRPSWVSLLAGRSRLG